MREILFKGKNFEIEAWFTGIPITTHIGTFMVFEENPHYCSQYGYMEIDGLCEVDSNTISEFTGLYDCTTWEELTEEEQEQFLLEWNCKENRNNTEDDWKGRKIFENDIVEFTVFDYNGIDTQYKGVVVYSGSRFMIWKSKESEYYGNDGGFDLDWVLYQDDEFKVVGNIFDDEYLLK